jgi:hypothetical protein
MNTDRLIEHLADQLVPVQPLRRPGFRAFVWLCGASAFLGVLAFSMTSTADVAINGTGIEFVGPQLAAGLTGILAAWAAFTSVIPGYTRTAFVWPVVASLVWIGALAVGVPQAQTAAIRAAPHEWTCVAVIVLSGAPLMAAMWLMLRRGAPLHPGVTAALAALAVGALANVAACVSDPHTDHAVTLVWHGATIAVLAGAAAVTGRLAFAWKVRALPAPETGAR